MDASSIKTAIHLLSQILEIPAIIILIIAVLLAVFELASVIAEFFSQRFKKKFEVTSVLHILKDTPWDGIPAVIENSRFQKGPKAAFAKLFAEGELPIDERRLFATQLLADEEHRCERKMRITDIISRIAPMFGLMATLIPLGPGLIALGQGDTKTLADSLLTAFDATVSGLAAAGICYIISKVRKNWYLSDMDAMETVMEEVILK